MPTSHSTGQGTGPEPVRILHRRAAAGILSDKHLADEILGALERKVIPAYYQPQFDARTLDVVGVRRWRGGTIRPAVSSPPISFRHGR